MYIEIFAWKMPAKEILGLGLHIYIYTHTHTYI